MSNHKELAHNIVSKIVEDRAKLVELAKATGVDEKDVDRFIKQVQYRALYNQRPEVKAKRQAYNKARQEVMKTLRQAVRADKSLQDAVAAQLAMARE